jgi:hypothetical protein
MKFFLRSSAYTTLRRIFGPKRDEVTGEWRKQHNEQLNDLDRSTNIVWVIIIYFLWHCSPARAMASSFTRFLDHTQRRATVSMTPLDKWSVCRRDLYLTTHNRQTSMPPVGFEPTIAAGERPYIYVLDRAANRTGIVRVIKLRIMRWAEHVACMG